MEGIPHAGKPMILGEKDCSFTGKLGMNETETIASEANSSSEVGPYTLKARGDFILDLCAIKVLAGICSIQRCIVIKESSLADIVICFNQCYTIMMKLKIGHTQANKNLDYY